MSIEAMKRIKSLLQDGDKIDSHTISAVVAECDAVILTQQPATGELEPYDAGLLNDFGGGNVEWWQDYIRAELGHAHDFYQAQIATPQPAQATQAEVTDEQIESEFQQCGGKWNGDQWVIEDADLHPFCRTILALRPQQSGLTGCNCRWDGDTQVQWCELHLAHKEAIHEWAERAKEAEKQLALRPAAVPMTGEQWTDVLESAGPDLLDLAKRWSDNKVHVYQVVNEAEKIVKAAVLRGITAQDKKEAP